MDAAEDVADEIRRGADGYAGDILATLEAEAAKALASIRKGIEVLDDRRAELQAAATEIEPAAVADDHDGGTEAEAPLLR
ncbi:MAG: hypothetical protein ACHQ3P_02840 [Candidatus Limnocylindrales bacterium]